VEDDEARDSAAVFPSQPYPPLLPFRATRRCFGAGREGQAGGVLWLSWLLARGGLRWGRAGGRVCEAMFGKHGGRFIAGGRFGLRTSARPAKIAYAAVPTDLDGRVGRPWNPLHLGGLASAGARLATARRAPPHAARSRPSLAWGRAADGRHAARCGRNGSSAPGFRLVPLYYRISLRRTLF
jgi:hypothetical protein